MYFVVPSACNNNNNTRRRVARKHFSSRRKSEFELSVKCSVWSVKSSELRQCVGLCVCIYVCVCMRCVRVSWGSAWVSVCDVCVWVPVCVCLLLVKVFTVDIVKEVARRPPKPPTGGQAVRAFELLVKGNSKAHSSSLRYSSCTTESPGLIFQLPSYSAS